MRSPHGFSPWCVQRRQIGCWPHVDSVRFATNGHVVDGSSVTGQVSGSFLEVEGHASVLRQIAEHIVGAARDGELA